MNGGKSDGKLEKRLSEPLLFAILCHPLLVGAVLFLLLSALLVSWNVTLRMAALVALFAFSLSFFLFSRGRDVERARLFSYLLLLVCGALCLSEGIGFLRETLPAKRLSELSSEGEISFRAEVRFAGEASDVLFLEEAEGVSLGVYARVPHTEEWEIGDVFSARGVVCESGDSEAETRCVGGCVCRFSVELSPSSVVFIQRESALSRLRIALSEAVSSAKSAPFLRSILLADSAGVSPALKTWMQRLGASHLFALSGLHLGLLTGFLHLFLRAFSVHRRLRLFLCMLFGLLFTLLCGAPLSLLRAFGMMFSAFLWEMFSLRQNSVQTLFLASSVIVLFDRGAVRDAGFLLSVLATLGILLALPLFRASFFRSRLSRNLEKRGGNALVLRRFLLSGYVAFCTSFSALCFTLPVAASVFSQVAPLSPLFGIVLIPLFTVLLFCAFLFLLFSVLGISCFLPFSAWLCDALAFVYFDVSEWLSSFSPLVSVSPVSAFVASALLIAFVLFCLYYRVRARITLLALPVFLTAVFLAETLVSLVF